MYYYVNTRRFHPCRLCRLAGPLTPEERAISLRAVGRSASGARAPGACLPPLNTDNERSKHTRCAALTAQRLQHQAQVALPRDHDMGTPARWRRPSCHARPRHARRPPPGAALASCAAAGGGIPRQQPSRGGAAAAVAGRRSGWVMGAAAAAAAAAQLASGVILLRQHMQLLHGGCQAVSTTTATPSGPRSRPL